jgi:hypothetical protein
MKYILKSWQYSWDQQISRAPFPSWKDSLLFLSKSMIDGGIVVVFSDWGRYYKYIVIVGRIAVVFSSL